MKGMTLKQCIEVLDDYLLYGECRITKVAWGRIRKSLIEEKAPPCEICGNPASTIFCMSCGPK